MIKKLYVSNFIKLPETYICDNDTDADICKENKWSYMIRPRGWSDYACLLAIFIPYLKKEYPYIKWDKVFQEKTGKRFQNTLIIFVDGGDGGNAHKSEDSDVADIATSERTFDGSVEEDYCERSLAEHFGDTYSQVNIDVLNTLRALPKFMSDIADGIYRKSIGYDWEDGYNKKLDLCIGTHESQHEMRNLIIIDVSGSIPRGISATMISMMESLRHMCNADLIVTGSKSMYWAAGENLPTPQWVRNHIGFANEADDFYRILEERIQGNEFGNVIVFGDEDCPGTFARYGNHLPKIFGTKVHKLWSYHTRYKRTPGYGKWVQQFGCEASDFSEERSTDWCSIIDPDA